MGGRNKIDLTGKRINFLTVLGPLKNNGKRIMWSCKCDCGVIIEVAGGHLCSKGRTTRSCRDCLYKRLTKHGKANSQSNKAWQDMKARCNRPTSTGYKNYGGRGIIYCVEWELFENFYTDMGDPPSKLHSLDRIDVNGNYCKENCRWATMKEQSRNKRSNRVIEINGVKKCLSEWCEIYKIKYCSVWGRERDGMNIIDAITKPKKVKTTNQ